MSRQSSSEKTNRRFIVLRRVGRSSPNVFPLERKTQDLVADVIDMRISKRPALFDQFHRIKRIQSLRDKDAGTHCHPAVTSARAVSVDLAAMVDHFERRPHTALQLVDRNGEERTVYCSQRQKAERLNVRI